ncbi:MAG: hypothetical protein IMZ53_14210 [Thermoplasmata archaeon]|nr:hypothetical protein [Thermoplasmata archaeon]MBE3141725.1 hypothetical protein [Thermoplasmata archaeon]
MKWKEIIVGGILVGFVIVFVDIILGGLIQFIWSYDIFKLGGMRKIDDPIMLLFFVHPWVLSFMLTFVYSYFGKALDGNYITKGWKFGLLMWTVVFVPYAFLVYTSMNYPIGFTVNSVIPPLAYMLLSGILIAKTFEWLE